MSDNEMKEAKNEGAKRFDLMKMRWDLLPYDALEKLVEVFSHGAIKYDDNNWRKGMSYSRMYGSMQRHIVKSIQGEDIDPDSGCLHLAQVAWNSICLLWYQMNCDYKGIDDRVKTLKDSKYTYDGTETDKIKQKEIFDECIKEWVYKRLKSKDNTEKIDEDSLPPAPKRSEIYKTKVFDDQDYDLIPREEEVYYHYKGGSYKILSISFMTEGDNEAVVTYRCLSTGKQWTRPLDMFNEIVEFNGQKVRRFKLFRGYKR